MTSLDQNTPLSAEKLAEIRRRPIPHGPNALWILKADRDALVSEVDRLNKAVDLLGTELQKASADFVDALQSMAAEIRAELQREVESLTETAHNQARMISELTSACMAAEQERDQAVENARRSAEVMVKVGLGVESAMRSAEAAGAHHAAGLLGDLLADADPSPVVQPVPDGGETR